MANPVAVWTPMVGPHGHERGQLADSGTPNSDLQLRPIYHRLESRRAAMKRGASCLDRCLLEDLTRVLVTGAKRAAQNCPEGFGQCRRRVGRGSGATPRACRARPLM
jgi:hypothetical protein